MHRDVSRCEVRDGARRRISGVEEGRREVVRPRLRAGVGDGDRLHEVALTRDGLDADGEVAVAIGDGSPTCVGRGGRRRAGPHRRRCG